MPVDSFPQEETVRLLRKLCVLHERMRQEIRFKEVAMELLIDGRTIVPQAGESLLMLLQKLGLDSREMTKRPIAAKIAGEVFNLNYIPVRSVQTEHDRPSIRRAMAASNGKVQLLRYTDPIGQDVYTRTAQTVVFMALQRLYPKARAKMNCTLGRALYMEVRNVPDFDADALKRCVSSIVEEDVPLLRQRVRLQEAIDHFTRVGQTDKARLLKWRTQPYFDQYAWGGFADYYYGELAPSTGYLSVWDLQPYPGGFLFLFPDEKNPEAVAVKRDMPNVFSVFSEGERWCELMECETVADLNELVADGRIRELIRVNEALHEKRYSQISDMVCERGAQIMMLAGPSSSGKTTSANRLATQLRVHGKKPMLISLDDYYLDRDKILPGPDGKLDLEHINTIDTALFGQHLKQLLSGEEVSVPHFNFQRGKREWRGKTLRLTERSVMIVEGLHALNPVLLPADLDRDKVFRVYISPLLPLNLDDHNRIPTSLLRLLRRIVRDYETRGATVQRTMDMWDSVRRGEERWIFPFQENADAIFNSSTLYELAVLKKHIFPLLTAIEPEEPCYVEVRSLVKILNYVLTADVDDEIPPTSLVREFIGGNSFYR